ncbi:hypothetical protein EPUL_004208, partial [Erysiphe pulchra]
MPLSLFFPISIFLYLSIIQTVLAIPPLERRTPPPISSSLSPISLVRNGYNCGYIFISGEKLNTVLDAVKNAQKHQEVSAKAREQLANYYNGPPFTKNYLLWPVAPDTDNYEEALNTPLRVVLNENFRIISVIIMQNDQNVMECRMKETLKQPFPFDFKCSGDYFRHQDLMIAVKAACPKIRGIASRPFPARYDESHFLTYGQQRYIYPIVPKRTYIHDQAQNMQKIDGQSGISGGSTDRETSIKNTKNNASVTSTSDSTNNDNDSTESKSSSSNTKI